MLLSLLASVVVSQSSISPGINSRQIEVDGVTRTYLLYVPKSYQARKSTPMLVMLHGYTGNARVQIPYTGLDRVAEKEGFLALIPDGQGMPRGWNVGFLALTGRQDDAKFVLAALDSSEKELNVDKRRVYVAGHSNGGMMANYLGSIATDRFAALGSVAGTIGTEGRAGTNIPLPKGRISAILIHGVKDATVPYDAAASRMGWQSVSAPKAAQWWAKQNELGETPRTEIRDDQVKAETWSRRGRREQVVLLSLPEQGHDYLRAKRQADGSFSGFDTTTELWNFFKSKRR
ncbi:MAG: alpha/beta hydrolase family esterase [Fimbriimonas sp.]